MTYTRAERDLLITALGRLLHDAERARPGDVDDGYEADPDAIRTLRDKVRRDAGPDLHLAQADVGATRLIAVGTTAEQAARAMHAALTRLGDDLDLDPALTAGVAACTLTGPPGAAWRDCHRYL